MTGTVVVFGATSYVGSSLIARLLERGRKVIGVSRGTAPAKILLPPTDGRFSMATPEDVGQRVAGEPISIVNLAFVKNAPPEDLYRQNRRLVDSIDRVAENGCERLIHISTAAVFSYVFEAEPKPVRVRWRPGDEYIESKTHAEHLIERVAAHRDCPLAIVRLGNVIGSDSPLYVAGIADKVIEGAPLGYRGEEGFCNAAHVANISAYLDYALTQPPDALEAFGTYHHLAEFSAHRWPELLDVISDEVGLPWETAVRPPPPPRRIPGPRSLVKAAHRTRAGGYMRAAIASLPGTERTGRLLARARGAPAWPELRGGVPVPPGGEMFLEVLSAAYQFRSHTLPGWEPELGFDSACDGIRAWLRTAGYSLKPVGSISS